MPVFIVAKFEVSPGRVGSKRRLDRALQIFVGHGPDGFLCSSMALISVGLQGFHRGECFELFRDCLAFRIRTIGSLRCKPTLDGKLGKIRRGN